MNIAVISLGCPKNQCDADVFCKTLINAGNTIVPNIETAELAIVNTCGFIQSAKEEAIEAILTCTAAKEENPNLKVLVTGCLAQRYAKEIEEEIPEVDGILGIGGNAEIAEIADKLILGGRITYTPEKELLPVCGPRVISTPGHYAYLKIAEGCENRCSYCAIPLIRGPLRSRPLESALEEAAWLSAQGVKEIIIVAQDITAYGVDLYGEVKLPQLLAGIEEIPGIRWVRLLYTYPNRMTDELLEFMAKSKKVLPYIDMPLQHINTEVLKAMNRKGDRQVIESAIARLRAKVPGIAIRTTFIAGYPTETQRQFDELYEFIKEAKFERLGCFAYSEEEGTTSAALQQLPQNVRTQRAAAIMELQTGIMEQKQKALVGSTQLVICDEYSEEDGAYICRTRFDAPEIDGVCFVATGEVMLPGHFYNVKIEDSDLYDLYASYIEEA